MKKTYMKPSSEVILINMEQTLLAGSGGVSTGSPLGDVYEETDVTYARELDDFFE